jgi:hypothetical protein
MADMWKPTTADELIRAIEAGSLPHEAAAFEVKAQLPTSKASRDIAIDVSAMATEGGVMIYGVLEDKAAMTFSPTPVELAGVKDRISDVVTANVRERIDFDIQLLPLDNEPTRGFVVVDIPASVRAPHMVETKGEFRFYGRVPGGNAVLTEAQIALLYDRRRKVEQQAERTLDEALAAAPLSAIPGTRGDLHLVARPLLSDRGLRRRAWRGDEDPELGAGIIAARDGIHFKTPWDPKFADILNGGQNLVTLDGFAILNPVIVREEEIIERWVARVEVLDDGTSRYFRAAVAEQDEHNGHYVIRDTAVAQIASHFLLMVGRLLDAGDYHGAVELSVAIMGGSGAVSAEWFNAVRMLPTRSFPAVPLDDYRDSLRAPVSRLVNEPCAVAASLLSRILRALRPPSFPDPFQRSEDGNPQH